MVNMMMINNVVFIHTHTHNYLMQIPSNDDEAKPNIHTTHTHKQQTNKTKKNAYNELIGDFFFGITDVVALK